MNPKRFLLVIGFLASAAASASAEEPKTPASPAPASPAPAPTKSRVQAAPAQAPLLRSVKAFNATLDGLDGDTKTISFTSDDGKSYTVPVEMPGSPEAQERAFALAAALKPGDKIVVFCKVNQKEEPTAATALRLTDPNAPSRFR
jgi:hypothetical protein